MRNAILIGAALLTLWTTGAAFAAESACTPTDQAAAQLKTPLIRSNDDAIQLTKQYFRLATDQPDMFDKRKYAIDVTRAGEVWTATIVFMRRPRMPWDDWKRRGRVGRVTLCGYDGHLISWDASY